MRLNIEKYRRLAAFIGLLVLLATLWLTIPAPFNGAASAASYWKAVYGRFAGTAGETLALGDVVCIAAADGKIYKADANDSSLRPAVGVIGKGGASGAVVEVIVSGTMGGQTAASPGNRLFLSETAGALTTTGPTNAQVMGWVLPGTAGESSSTDYYILALPETSAGAGF